MSETAAHIIYYINSVIYAGMSYYGLTCLLNPLVKKRWILLSYAGFLIISSQQFFVFDNVWGNLIIHLISFSAIALLFSGSYEIKIVYASILYIISLVADAISYVIVSYIFFERYGAELPQVYVYSIVRTVTNIIYLPLLLLCVLVFRKLFAKKVKGYSLIPIRYTASVFIMLAGIMLIDALFLVLAAREVHVNIGLVAFSQFVVLLIIFLVVWHYNDMLDYLKTLEANKQKDQTLERWLVQYETAVSSQKELLKIRHNIKFHFVVLAGFLKDKAIAKAENYLEEKLGEIGDVVKTGNLPIDTMLNYYQRKAKDILDIDLETDLMLPPNMKLDAELIAIIIGNALENALEACEKVVQADRYLRIKAVTNKKGTTTALFLTITNPYVTAPVVDCDGNFLTTKCEKNKHGLGLGSIQEMLEDKKGYVHCEYENNTFKFMLMYYDVLE